MRYRYFFAMFSILMLLGARRMRWAGAGRTRLKRRLRRRSASAACGGQFRYAVGSAGEAARARRVLKTFDEALNPAKARRKRRRMSQRTNSRFWRRRCAQGGLARCASRSGRMFFRTGPITDAGSRRHLSGAQDHSGAGCRAKLWCVSLSAALLWKPHGRRPGETSICAASMAARNDGTNAGGIIMEKRKRRIKILVTLTAAALLFAAVAQAATTLGWAARAPMCAVYSSFCGSGVIMTDRWTASMASRPITR